MNIKEALRQSGQNLQTIRKDKNYSIAALSVFSGVDTAIIIAMESGDFDFPLVVVYELSAALNVDFRQILVDPTAYG